MLKLTCLALHINCQEHKAVSVQKATNNRQPMIINLQQRSQGIGAQHRIIWGMEGGRVELYAQKEIEQYITNL